MENLTLRLHFKNESSNLLKLCIEPYCDFFYIQPGQKVIINAICINNAGNLEFEVFHNESYVTIYAPGAPINLLDVYLTLNGVKLTPEDE